jgi:vacuolar-type H+-ATPase subunit E/Vma4
MPVNLRSCVWEQGLFLLLRRKASTEERKQRSRLLAARDTYIQKLNEEAKGKLSGVATANPTAYSNLLKGLIKQGMARLTGDTKVEVRCRPQDAEKVRQLTPLAVAELLAELKAAGEERVLTATVVSDQTLGTSAGGVILSALDGKIKCNNMLEERLKLAMQDLQPVIRDLLFPSARAEVRIKPAINIHVHAPVSSKPPAPAPKPVPAPAPAPQTAQRSQVGGGVGFGSFGAPAPAPASKPAPAADPFAADPFAFHAPAPAPAAADPFAF